MAIRSRPIRVVATALLLAAGTGAFAGERGEPPLDQAIHSMFVRGSIEVGPDGKVQHYSIDQAGAYSPPIRGMLERVIPGWTFRPVTRDGAAQVVRSPMFLRLQANPAGDGQFRVDIASAAFGAGSGALASDALASRQMKPPKYPRDEIRAGIGAQVIAAVKVRRDGTIEDVVIEQTNLTRVGTSRAMAQWRKDFEQTAMAAVAQWRFAPPTTGPEAARPYWSARIPVVYTAGPEAASAGRWRTFVPGPRHPVPWATEEELATASDALPDGGVFPMTPTLRLLTPLNQG